VSKFVDECREEWKRLGVPEAVSNEMAADLTADLDEAEAEGASPEQVLGNGVFDAKSFAASWARARGVVRPRRRVFADVRRPRWTVIACAAVAFVTGVAGLAIVAGRQSASVGVSSVRRSMNLPNLPGFFGPRGILVPPHFPGQLTFVSTGTFQALGLVLLGIGFIALLATLWFWKPWASLRRRPDFDEDIELPSYL
jgi:hypothetical protein